MIESCIIWRREPKQPAMEAILSGATHYRKTRGQTPNFVNTPPGFLTEAELAQAREKFTVATDAPAYFRDEIWLGVMTPARGLDTARENAPTHQNLFEKGESA